MGEYVVRELLEISRQASEVQAFLESQDGQELLSILTRNDERIYFPSEKSHPCCYMDKDGVFWVLHFDSKEPEVIRIFEALCFVTRNHIHPSEGYIILRSLKLHLKIFKAREEKRLEIN